MRADDIRHAQARYTMEKWHGHLVAKGFKSGGRSAV